VTVVTYVVLRLSTRVVLVVGLNGMNALTKIMGFLLVCVGIEFVVNGVAGVITGPEVLGVIKRELGK